MSRALATSGRLLPVALLLLLVASLLVPSLPTRAATGFRHQAYDLAELQHDELPWTSERPPRLPALPPRDANGVPMIRWTDGRLYYRPGEVAINGMKRIEAYLDTGNQAQLDQVLVQTRHLRRMALDRRDAWWLPFWFDYPGAGQRAPWFNAMTQGLVLSFFVRLYDVTGHAVHLDAARLVFRSFRRLDRHGPWVSYVDRDRYLWLEHYPMPRPWHVLNAHLWTAFGLYEFWQVTRSPAARELLEGAITTMRAHAWRYRRPGRVSRYDLSTGSAYVKYHEIHVWELRLLSRISGDRYFWRLADRFREDVRPAGYVAGRPRILRWPGSD